MVRSSILLFCLSSAMYLDAHAFEVVRACGGDSNWPPMSYVLAPSKTVEGLSAEILRTVLTPEPVISLRPWARCLAEVRAREGYDVVMSAFKTPEREAQFVFSRSYHSLTPAYLFSTEHFKAPPLKSLADLEKFKVCALHGASIFYTKLAPAQIESGATSYLSLIRKIDRGHCDIVVDMREVFLGFAKLGLLPFTANTYQILPLPETEKYSLHYGVSKQHPQALQLIERIDKGLNEMHRTGKLNTLIDKYQVQ
ncbi:substrate-binding periplasmic protein [Undibacterium parvum]|uniref:Transporter substrate-binding domain-containing protein n=1 Tax=Undibacterium parvum TaxID=401471 RepID=A0A3Q9BMY0_9BURK|nr:transporter substrate-binding domain-containing protein [Undibacterium parvum]AZP10601.1 transporter substrate-binding domain-containing protein [Undibacterium parvum]